MKTRKSDHKLSQDSKTGGEAFRLLFQHHPTPMWVYDLKTLAFLDVNDAAVEKYGYTRQEFLSMTLKDIRPQEDVSRLLDDVRRGRPELQHSGEWRHKLKGGLLIDVLITSHRLKFDGRPAALVMAEDISKRKRAMDALRTSEERYRGLFDHMAEGLAYCQMLFDHGVAADWVYVETNKAFETLTGLHNAKGRRVTDLIPGIRESDPLLFEIYGRVSQSGVHEKFEMFVSALQQWFSVSAYCPQKDFFVAIFNVITERKLAEEKLLAGERTLRLFVEYAPAAIAMLDREMKYIAASLRYIDDYKLKERNIVGRSHYEVFPEIPDRWKEIHKRCLAGATEKAEEDPFPREDGTLDWVRWEIHPWYEQSGRIGGIILFSEVITARKQAEEQIRKLNRVYAVLSNINQTIVRIHDPQRLFDETCRIAVDDGKFRFAWVGKVSPETRKLDVAACAGMTIEALKKARIDEVDTGQGQDPAAKAIRTGSLALSIDLEHDPAMLPRLDEMRRIGVRSSAAFPLMVSGRVWGVLNLYSAEPGFFDIDEVKLLDELAMDISFAILFIQQEVERKLAEEAKKSLEVQLHQAQKLESLGTLASGIAHDINNILGIIIGHASLLEGQPADAPTIRKRVEAITKASMRVTNLVKQMLTFARKSDVHMDSVLLNDVVDEVAKLLHELLPRTIVVIPQLDNTLPPIQGDPTHVHQVILNLCVNARDAMPDGGELTISTYRESGEALRPEHPKATAEDYVVLSVADNGTGMDKEMQRRIFEPFFTTKGRDKGTGLGLSVVFGIMESHSGFVTVQSEPGKGSTFRCYFPLSAATKETVHVDTTTHDISGGNETILVVEDEEMLRELLRTFLESKGYRVLTSADGEEALDIYTRHQKTIAVVVSDLGLPKFGGDELCRRLAKLNPGIRLIIASGYVDPAVRERMTQEGVREYVHKPYNPNELLSAIHTVLRGQ